ncbi:MAG: nitrogen regulation protein NR(II) [bacterium]
MTKILITDHRRILLLILTMVAIAFGVAGMTIFVLYQAAFEQQRQRLLETAQSRARIIEAMTRFDAQYSAKDILGGALAATMSQIRDAHARFEGFGETGEFTLAKREGDQIVFLLRHRHEDVFGTLEEHAPILIGSEYAQPMQLALAPNSGTVVGLDYRGEIVLAAYEPVTIEELILGIVAKIDLAEIRAPFINAGLLAGGIALVLVFFGTLLFVSIGNPLIRHLEESEMRYRRIFETVPVSLWEEDFSEVKTAIDDLRNSGVNDFRQYFDEHPDFVSLAAQRVKVLDVNDYTLKMYGAKSKQDMLTSLDRVFVPESLPVFQEQLISFAEGGRHFESESTNQMLHGGRRSVVLSVTFPGKMAEYDSVLVSILDITERKRAQEQIKNQNFLLQQAVEQKQHEMELLMERLIRQEKLAVIGQISGNIAHELRNPLGAIKQSVFFLKRLYKNNKIASSHSKVEEHLELLDTEIETSDRVITDLLKMTKMEPLEKSQMDLRLVISEAVQRCHIEDRIQVNINLNPEPFLMFADHLQMRQVFINLFTNAVQAIKGEGAIKIHAKMATKDKTCFIEVQDDGRGIALKYRGKVFEPLFTTKVNGTGLGLSICKQIIESHGGSITLSSRIYRGTTVKIQI